MPGIQDTAYPRFKKNINKRELEAIYTPTADEVKFTKKKTKGKTANLCFLVMLKTFQRLGYFVLIKDVPPKIIKHIVKKIHISEVPDLTYYDRSKTRFRHMPIIRGYLNIVPYNDESVAIIEKTVHETAHAKEDLADIINVVIEELVRYRHELPAFSTLRRIAFNGRAKVNNSLYRKITKSLSLHDKKVLDKLFDVEKGQTVSPWHHVKAEAKSVTVNNLKGRIDYVKWLAQYSSGVETLLYLPDVKIKQFAAEAKSKNANQMDDLKAFKKYALAICLVAVQNSIAIDDLGEMLIKLVNKTHTSGRAALNNKVEENQERTDILIDKLHQILSARKDIDDSTDRDVAIGSIIGDQGEQLLKNCEDHALYAGKNYFPFLWNFHATKRVALFNILDSITLVSPTQDNSLIHAIEFIKTIRKNRKVVMDAGSYSFPDIKLMSERWKKAVFVKNDQVGNPVQFHRQYYELCVFYYLVHALKSGDICIQGGDNFSDYRLQLYSWDEYYQLIPEYGRQVKLPVERSAFIHHTKSWFEEVAYQVDQSFPDNEYIRIENGKPIMKKVTNTTKIKGLRRLKTIIEDRMEPVTILDILNYTRQWVNWDKSFGPISGFDSKLEDPSKHYVVTAFCYGSNLGPTQTARSIKNFSRFQIARVNQRHVTEEKLNDAIVKIINTYNQFDLPKVWGSGKSASVDGTMWDLYEENLLSEYHIRYGGYGGIGYYHISDQYIALFSHFIPCGVHEAIYILDGLLQNESDIQPDTIHGDTHAQSETVFGLAYLLGIKLMPRIRNWKHLKFYKPSKETTYKHIDELFSDTINWKLIEEYLPDMLRVALSIKGGRISASSILRKLGSYSKKNKLYQAFRELGRVARTRFLLEYLNDKELREIIHAATCKSETFNYFAQWLMFGDEGIIKENNRDEQRKIIKYNHLLANCVSLYNVASLTKIINELTEEGYPIHQKMLESFSPYMTGHINRYGDYRPDFDQEAPELVCNIQTPEYVN